ncbi:hypothetical protein T4D_16111 [Trichinella pseudospiralis]|uniref:Uncharacterized protein n=1 Tax=Trichinella pseudospiralis TaxID=6337 RepID=A0A0V1FHL2_TRIPS|nr:hypothetical protein T4D_16111 [Trichinella pseudospiralis]
MRRMKLPGHDQLAGYHVVSIRESNLTFWIGNVKLKCTKEYRTVLMISGVGGKKSSWKGLRSPVVPTENEGHMGDGNMVKIKAQQQGCGRFYGKTLHISGTAFIFDQDQQSDQRKKI